MSFQPADHVLEDLDLRGNMLATVDSLVPLEDLKVQPSKPPFGEENGVMTGCKQGLKRLILHTKGHSNPVCSKPKYAQRLFQVGFDEFEAENRVRLVTLCTVLGTQVAGECGRKRG